MADTYYASVRESGVAAGKRHIAVFNGTGSGKKLVVYRIVVVGAPTGAVAGLKVLLAGLRLTTEPTDGTTRTFAKADPANANPPSQVTVRDGHTTGTVEAIAFGLGGVSGEETASDNESVLYQAPIDGSQPLTCPEGTGFEVRQGTLASAGAVSIVAVIGLE